MVFENDNKSTNTRRTSQRPVTYSGLGKLPPSACDVEEIVLGAILGEYNKIPLNIWGTLQPEMFYKDAHQKVFTEIINLRNQKKAVDIATVTSALRKAGNLEMVGGVYAMTELMERVANSSNIEHHVLIIHQMFLKRELIRIGSECVQNMYEDTSDVFTQISSIVTDVKNIEKGIFKRTEKNAVQLADEAIEEMNKPKNDGMLGIATGLSGLDFVLRGDQEGSLRVVAADTSSGKTVEMCSEVVNSCFDKNKDLLDNQTATAVFSLEMPSKQLTFRMVSDLSSVPNTAIKTNRLTPDERIRVNQYFDKFKQSQIFIDDTPGLNICEFETKAALLVAIHGVKRIYIDYFQLMKGDPNKKYGTRENELSDISRRLKTCAKELYISIIVYSQLGPEVHKRNLSIPMLNDLRECKALGFDADIVMFLWRPEYYENILNELKDKQTKIFCKLFNITIDEFENMCFIIVAKNRDGELGKIPFKFNGKIMRIYDHYFVISSIEAMNNAPLNQYNLITPESRDAPF